jgi:16S rRNA (guanine966-N2)-methyltransferase
MSPEMRIGGGLLRGRKIFSFGKAFRPTSGIIKKSLFDTIGPDIENARFLDLFAGSGAVGLEALSRGADRVCFVEIDVSTTEVIRKNIDRLEIGRDAYEILMLDYSRALGVLRDRREKFDYVYVDPPYGGAEPPRILGDIAASTVLAEDGEIVYESARRDARRIAQSVPHEFWPLKEKVHGGTALVFLRWRVRKNSGQEE